MNIKPIMAIMTACVISLCVNSANAAIISFEANLDGSQEVPSNTSTGTGFAAVTLDDVSNLLSWNVSWSGLSGPATAMHFHGPAAVGVNAPPVVNIGTISGLTSPSIGSSTISAGQASELLAGLWYINIHTALIPGGEIRGQVNAVPVPAAVWLFGSGLVGLIGIARRKKS